MIKQISKDFNIAELNKFKEDNPLRYQNLCRIIGEFTLDERSLYLGIVLPFSGDWGGVSANTIEDGVINVIDIKYF